MENKLKLTSFRARYEAIKLSCLTWGCFHKHSARKFSNFMDVTLIFCNFILLVDDLKSLILSISTNNS
jgi:hypothetical protein